MNPRFWFQNHFKSGDDVRMLIECADAIEIVLSGFLLWMFLVHDACAVRLNYSIPNNSNRIKGKTRESAYYINIPRKTWSLVIYIFNYPPASFDAPAVAWRLRHIHSESVVNFAINMYHRRTTLYVDLLCTYLEQQSRNICFYRPLWSFILWEFPVHNSQFVSEPESRMKEEKHKRFFLSADKLLFDPHVLVAR
jgi:hypothetical protein